MPKLRCRVDALDLLVEPRVKDRMDVNARPNFAQFCIPPIIFTSLRPKTPFPLFLGEPQFLFPSFLVLRVEQIELSTFQAL